MKKRVRESGVLPTKADRVAALGRVPGEVYALLEASQIPLGPYELLWRLQNQRGRSAPPPTIYRALGVLIDTGLAHRVAGIGGYVLCKGPDHHHEPAFFVCELCGKAREVEATQAHQTTRARLSAHKFSSRQINFIIRGVCSIFQATTYSKA